MGRRLKQATSLEGAELFGAQRLVRPLITCVTPNHPTKTATSGCLANPRVVLNLRHNGANLAARRLGVARALANVGLSALATEVALPEDIESSGVFLTQLELARLRRSRGDRQREAFSEAKAPDLRKFQRQGQSFSGRFVEIELPTFQGGSASFNSISLYQGVDSDFLHSLRQIEDLEADIDKRSEPFKNGKILIESDGRRTTMRYRDLFFSEMILRST